MRLVRVLAIVLGLMAIATTASFASVPFVTTSTVTQMAVNAQTGLAGNIQLTALAGGTINLGETILVTFNGAFISSLSDFQVATSMGIGPTVTTSGAPGAVVVAYNTPYPINLPVAGPAGPPSVKVTNSTILITFPAAVAFATGDSIQVSGVRLNVSGSAVLGNQLTTTISSALGSATVSNPTVSVAVFVEPIQILGVPNITVASYTTAGTAVTASGVVQVKELFTNAFETKGLTNETQLILRISNIPTGLALSTISINGATSATVTATIPATGSVTTTGTTATALVSIQTQDSTVLETIAVNLNFAVVVGATIPLPIGTATVAATLGPPLTTGFPSETYNIANNVSPIVVGGAAPPKPLRYLARYIPSPEVTILTITQLTTQLLAPFNSWIPGSFDTGFAISNTTGYPLSFTQNLGYLQAQAGNVVVYFYPADGSAAKTITTSSTVMPGSGLDVNGQIPAHGTWTVLLSTLATQAGFTGGFTGQVYFLVNASNAHGVNYIADSQFKVQAQGYPMLVLPTARSLAASPATTSIEGLGN